MEVKKLSVEATAEGTIVSVYALVKPGAKVEAEDVAELQRILGELQGGSPAPAEAPATGRRSRGAAAPAETASAETAPTASTSGRRARGSSAAPAETSDAQPATTGTAEPRRRRSAPEPEAAAPAEGRRRRNVEPEPEKLTDADLVRAASKANTDLIAAGKSPSEAQDAILDLVFQYDAEGQPAGTGCETIQEIKAGDRADFLAKLKALK